MSCRYGVKIFKYPDTSTGRILELTGGTGELKNFIRKYRDDIKKFKAPGLTQPVIILVDNDPGGKDVGGVISNIIKKQVKWTEPYIHVVANLYMMPTPLAAGAAESAIEDFFSPQTLGTVPGRKTFSRIRRSTRASTTGKRSSQSRSSRRTLMQ